MSTIKSDNSDLTINASGTSKDIKFQADGTERMVLKSDGKLGVGTASPSVILHSMSADQGVAHRVAYNTTYYTDYGYYGLNAQSNDFYIKTTGTERLRIDNANGDVNVKTGNLVIGTAGKGIDFSANTHVSGMSSELLDDYEEGTWTPVITASSGTINTYVISSANYTKIGRLCTINLYYYVTSNGTGSGYSKFTLPFTATSLAGYKATGGGVEVGHTMHGIIGAIHANGTFGRVTFSKDGTYPTNGGYNQITISYITA
jgi:hypothetical protein